MTKEELRKELLSGKTMEELLRFTDGQGCPIFKSDEFTPGDQIIYIPDLWLNEIPIDINLGIDNSMCDANAHRWLPMTATEQMDFVLDCCYTGADFVEACNGDEELGKCLFDYVDWQHPSSAYPEICDDEEA